MKFLSGLLPSREQTAQPTTGDAIARATGGSIGSTAGQWGLGQVGNWDVDKAVRDGLERVVWVFRCVDVIATNQASLRIGLKNTKSKTPLGEWVDDSRIEKLLNIRPNTYETAFQFRYRVSGLSLLSRRGVFIEVLNGKDGRPAQLHILPPGSTEPVPDPETFVSGYWVTRSDYKREWLPPEKVIWIRLKPHPTDPYLQITPLMSAGLSADIDYFARLFNRNFLMRDGRPGMLIGVRGMTNPLDAEELKRRFGGGPEAAGSVSVIESDDINVIDTSARPRDVQWSELLKGGKDEILVAFGVPESLMGNASGRTFSNADAERLSFWLDTERPHCDGFAAGFEALTGDLDDEIRWAFDYSTVDVLQEMEKKRRDELRAEVKEGLRTIDSYFEEIGEQPWDVPATRSLWHPTQVVIGRDDADQEAVQQLQKVGMGGMPGMPGAEGLAPEEDPMAVDAEFQDIDQGSSRFQELLMQSPAAQALLAQQPAQIEAEPSSSMRGRKAAPRTRRVRRVTETKDADGETHRVVEMEALPSPPDYLRDLRSYAEGMVSGVADGWSERQADVITDRLVHVKSRRGTRHWQEGPESTPESRSERLSGDLRGSGPSATYKGSEARTTIETKALDPEYAVEIDRWVRELVEVMRRRLAETIKKSANGAVKELRTMGVLPVLLAQRGHTPARTSRLIDLAFNDLPDLYLGPVYDAVAGVIEQAARNQTMRVMKVIADKDAEGASMTEIQKAVRKMIGQRAQWRRSLATNIVTAATEGAREAVMKQAGALVEKRWNAHMDERTRSSHLHADAQQVGMHEMFDVGSTRMPYPGWPAAPAEEVVNCRCWLSYHPTSIYDELRESV